MGGFEEALTDNAAAVNEMLDRLLPLHDDPEARVIEAMRYAALGGGKRIRPFMATSAAALFNVAPSCALRVAAAIEMVHAYSLVHDDLPAMDDDEIRRGRPTCHIQYDEATAILAGDGLLTRAFEVLGEADTHSDPAVRAELVVALGRAAGGDGMVGGQMLDLLAADHVLAIPEVARLQRLKTGMLIGFACESGAILGKAPAAARQALRAYAHDLGLAFQIVDDILDIEGDEAQMGKKTGKDEDAGKATFVSLLGLERAREQAGMLAGQAAQHLEMFAETADPLRSLARFVLERRS